MAIDIGSEATDRNAGYDPGYTDLLVDNPANAAGTIDTVELWFVSNGTGVKVGTFYGSGTSYTNRDYATIGDVPSGSKQTFTGLSIAVQTGDLIGTYASNGVREASNSDCAGVYEATGDQMGTGAQTYTLYDGETISAYGTGTESAPGAATQFMTPKKYW